jgi:DnaJ family protein B protein 12
MISCSHLRNKCFHEKSYRENLLWQARYSGNENLLTKAQHYPMPACSNLEKIYAAGA